MPPRAGGAKLGGALPKLRSLCPKTVFFGSKRPQNLVKLDQQRELVGTLHMRPDFLVTNRRSQPYKSKVRLRNGSKMPQNGPDFGHFVSTSPKTKNGPYLRLRGSKPKFEGT